jgi:hypothetical protein
MFVFSLGSFQPDRDQLWIQKGFSELEAKTILKQQLICLMEFPIAFFVGCVLSAVASR